jgi:Fe-S cluster assembly scaffold protein SufB
MAQNESEKVRAYRATRKSDPRIVEQAARIYVNKGLKDLKLSSEQYTKLQNKLTPIVQKTIQAERGRTAVRGEAVVNRTAAKKVKAATKKIMGGK